MIENKKTCMCNAIYVCPFCRGLTKKTKWKTGRPKKRPAHVSHRNVLHDLGFTKKEVTRIEKKMKLKGIKPLIIGGVAFVAIQHKRTKQILCILKDSDFNLTAKSSKRLHAWLERFLQWTKEK